VAALASWLDARAHQGRWLVRIEDVDQPRSVAGADQIILQQLMQCGMAPDETPVWQSTRTTLYQQALDSLISSKAAYPCACTRQDIEAVLNTSGQARVRHGELVYPGTCRNGLQGRPIRAWRLACSEDPVNWQDRWLGPQSQNVQRSVGDFVLKRADGFFAYQLAVVVDDAAQGVTHIVRGADLADNTARQILLQRALGLPTPVYLHVPLVLGANGEKLSKQNDAQALDTGQPLTALYPAASTLGLQISASTLTDWLAQAVQQWAQRWRLAV
jgi:glutamyl-Q tRNA(Asp) synthetase